MMPSSEPSVPCASASEWMRVFACRLALRRPELDAATVIGTAIDEFKHSHGVAPEVAAEQCGAGHVSH